MDRTLGDNYIVSGGKRQFTDGPPGTTIDADFMNQVQEEIVTAITNAGFTPSGTDRTQLYKAILELSGRGIASRATAEFTERTNPKAKDLQSIATDGTNIVAVGVADGADAYIVRSTDGGATWTEVANAKNISLLGICYGAGTFVAVGGADGADAYILTSTDGGASWTEQANPKNFALNDVVWCAGLGLFVAVGVADGADAYVVTSPTGAVWTERSNAKNLGLYGVAWNGKMLAAVGAAEVTDAYIVTSPDGVTWTEKANPLAGTAFVRIISNGSSLVAVGYDGHYRIITYTSVDDGDTWLYRYIATGNSTVTMYGLIWTGFAYIAVGYAGGIVPYAYYSYEGMDWVPFTLNTTSAPLDAVWSGHHLVVVGSAGTDAYIATGPTV